MVVAHKAIGMITLDGSSMGFGLKTSVEDSTKMLGCALLFLQNEISFKFQMILQFKDKRGSTLICQDEKICNGFFL